MLDRSSRDSGNSSGLPSSAAAEAHPRPWQCSLKPPSAGWAVVTSPASSVPTRAECSCEHTGVQSVSRVKTHAYCVLRVHVPRHAREVPPASLPGRAVLLRRHRMKNRSTRRPQASPSLRPPSASQSCRKWHSLRESQPPREVYLAATTPFCVAIHLELPLRGEPLLAAACIVTLDCS